MLVSFSFDYRLIHRGGGWSRTPPCAGGVGGGGSVFAILMYDDVVCRCVVFNVDDLIAWHGIHYAARKSHELRLCSGRVRPARGEELLPVGYTQAHELYHQ